MSSEQNVFLSDTCFPKEKYFHPLVTFSLNSAVSRERTAHCRRIGVKITRDHQTNQTRPIRVTLARFSLTGQDNLNFASAAPSLSAFTPLDSN